MLTMTSDDLNFQLQTLCWTQADLARSVGVTPNTVYRWMAGLVPIPYWLVNYLDMAVMVHRCVSGQAVLSMPNSPMAIFDLADRIGIAYAPICKEQQRENDERTLAKLRKEWLPAARQGKS